MRSMLSTYRTGFLISGTGLSLLLFAIVSFVRRPVGQEGADVLAGLQTSAVCAVVGLGVTFLGFVLMNLGTNAWGSFSFLDAELPVNAEHGEGPPLEDTPSEAIGVVSEVDDVPLVLALKCLACGVENRTDAKFCDQCGERL